MLFEPREVVVVVDLLFDAGSQQTGDTSADPVAARVGVDATELHGSDVLRAEIARYIKEDGIDHHSILGSGGLEEPRRDAMAEAARAKVHADPDVVLLVDEDVDVVVSATDGSELRLSPYDAAASRPRCSSLRARR